MRPGAHFAEGSTGPARERRVKHGPTAGPAIRAAHRRTPIEHP